VNPRHFPIPEDILIAPTQPIYAAVRREGKCRERDRRLNLFRLSSLPACGNRAAVAGPALGAPAAALLVESLVRSGAGRILLFSVCGSITPSLRIGDLFIPSGGISEEGTSKLYQEGPPADPDPLLLREIEKSCEKNGLTVPKGRIWTTDAPCMEDPGKIEQFRNQGALTVDMEFTALSTVAKIRKIPFAALMVVSDERLSPESGFAFQIPEFRAALRTGIRILLRVFSGNVI